MATQTAQEAKRKATKHTAKRKAAKSVVSKLAEITKDQQKMVDEQKPPIGLNHRQALFCIYYTQIDSLRSNGTLSYAEAYGYDLDSLPDDDAVYSGKGKNRKLIKKSTRRLAYDVCSAEASRMLRVPKIQDIYVRVFESFIAGYDYRCASC